MSKIMKKLIVILLLSPLLFSGCGITNLKINPSQENNIRQAKPPAPKPEKDQLVFRLADNWSEDYPSVLGCKEFARLVEERSNGKLKIIVYPNAVLGDEKSVIRQLQLGGIDFARVNSAPLIDVDQKIGVLSLPYLFRDSNHLWNVLLGPIGDELLASLTTGGITGLAYYDSGARSFYTKKPISQISDLKGLRIRVQQSEAFEDYIRLLGAIPVPLPFGEVFNSLQKDETDGAENNWPSYYHTNHYKIAKYYILDEHTRNPELIVANSKVMNKLSEEDRQIIISSAKDSIVFERNAWADAEKESEDNIKKSGTRVIYLDNSERELLEEKIAPLYIKYGKGFQSLIERIKNAK